MDPKNELKPDGLNPFDLPPQKPRSVMFSNRAPTPAERGFTPVNMNPKVWDVLNKRFGSGAALPFSPAAMAFRAGEDAVAATLYQGSSVAFDVETNLSDTFKKRTAEELSFIGDLHISHKDRRSLTEIAHSIGFFGARAPKPSVLYVTAEDPVQIPTTTGMEMIASKHTGKPQQHGDVKSSAKKEVRVSGLLKGLMGKVKA